MFLAFFFSENGATTSCDDVSAHRAVFKEFEFRSMGNGVSDLVSPAGIGICRKFVSFVNRGASSE